MEDLVEILSRLYSFKKDTPTIWQEALTKHKVKEEEWEGVKFLRLDKPVHSLERGTILSDDGIIRGYPRIRRILNLSNGIKRNLSGTFYVEEKVDGYNVRVARLEGRVVALSRGGYVCPFTTDRLPDLIDYEPFFNENPELVLCCEVAGPESPYNTESPPYIKEDVKLFVFDIMRKGGQVLSPKERYRLAEKYNLPVVKSYGSFTPEDTEKVLEIAEEMDREGLEGMVLKPEQGGRYLKYTVPSSHINDIRATAILVKDIPCGFYLKRILMLGFALEELKVEDSTRRAHLLGEVFTSAIKEAQEIVLSGKEITERFTVRFRKKENMERFFSLFRKAPVDVKILSEELKDGYIRVTFDRIYRRSTAFIRSSLGGATFID